MESGPFSLSQYDYQLPAELIAQHPLRPRSSSRLLVIDRKSGRISESVFRDIADLLDPGDVLVLNDTKVIRARLAGRRKSGAKLEVLLLREQDGLWQALVNPAKRARLGEVIYFDDGLSAEIVDRTAEGGRLLRFSSPQVLAALDSLGKTPLPPYIKADIDDPQKYQTVYADKEGAVAAPTAGFHFTDELLKKIKAKGVKLSFITLHCGLSTFRPVKTVDIREHPMGSEWVEISPAAAAAVNSAKAGQGRVIGVGTTTVRALESAACLEGGAWRLKPFCADTTLYMTPNYEFKVVDALITNFHTPCSTNLILASCFCGARLLKQAYDYAIEQKFRFYSFGDATLIV